MKWITIIQVIIAILLALSILSQNRGSGIGGIFGGSDSVYRAKRGLEKILFISTIVLSVLFFAISLFGIFYSVK